MARSFCVVLALSVALFASDVARAATACEHRLKRLAEAGDRSTKRKLAAKLRPFLRGLRGAERRVCQKQVERALRGLLSSWAKQARRGAGMDALGISQLWLELFPRHDKAPLVRFARAGLLYQLARFRAAALAYGAIGGLPTAKRKAALRRVVLAWQKHLKKTRPWLRQRKQRPSTKAWPIADRKPMFAAFAAFVALAPKSAEAIMVRFRQARVLYDYNHLGPAAKLFLELAEQHPQHASAPSAAQLALDALNRQGKTAELTRWAKRLLSRPKLARGRLRDTLRRVYQTGLFKRAEEAGAKHHFEKCGQLHLAAAKANPKSRRAASSLYNAALCFERAKKIKQAISVRERLLEASPAPQIAQRTRFFLAGNYHQRKDHRRAAALYVAYAKGAKANDQDAARGLLYAITVHMRSGKRRRARELFRKLESIAPKQRRLVEKARGIVH